jgi:cathepsin A (carboxypeptidase C)
MEWIETWMNDPSNKKALGVPAELHFTNCNSDVGRDFFIQGDGTHNSAALLPEIIDDGLRLLVYAGNAGELCFHDGR